MQELEWNENTNRGFFFFKGLKGSAGFLFRNVMWSFVCMKKWNMIQSCIEVDGKKWVAETWDSESRSAILGGGNSTILYLYPDFCFFFWIQILKEHIFHIGWLSINYHLDSHLPVWRVGWFFQFAAARDFRARGLHATEPEGELQLGKASHVAGPMGRWKPWKFHEFRYPTK